MIEVYHNSKFLEYALDPTMEALKKGLFECVAHVDTDDLNKAYELTNNIEAEWPTNAECRTSLVHARSTSVGDLLKKDGKFYLVDVAGFVELTREDECYLTFFSKEVLP
jgi:hypothetical protein